MIKSSLEGKVALVTGGIRGLGEAIARSLGNDGCRIALNYLKDHARARECVEHLQGAGIDCAAFPADIADPTAVETLRKAVESHFGSVDILINNAGYIARPGNWDLLHGEGLDRTIDTNLKGVILTIQEFAPAMIASGWGRIVNISSTYAITGAAGVLAYTAAKAGVITVTLAMARELGSKGVTVNAIAPGNFDTQMADDAGEGFKQWVRETAPLGRLGDPDEIGEAAAFLVRSNYITGQVLVVDGGHLLNM